MAKKFGTGFICINGRPYLHLSVRKRESYAVVRFSTCIYAQLHKYCALRDVGSEFDWPKLTIYSFTEANFDCEQINACVYKRSAQCKIGFCF